MSDKELSDDEKLVLADVLIKKLKEVSDDLKGAKKRRLIELSEEDGVDSMSIIVNGEKVGSVSLPFSNPRIDIRPGLEADAISYLDDCGLAKKEPTAKWRDSFQENDNGDVVCTETGEVVNDLFYVSGRVALSPRVTVGKSATRALRPLLQGIQVAKLLED